MLLNWLRKRAGIHVCEEFTQWQTFTKRYVHADIVPEGSSLFQTCVRKTTVVKRFQERRCTLCSKIQQERIH